jgi:hypothetical protein
VRVQEDPRQDNPLVSPIPDFKAGKQPLPSHFDVSPPSSRAPSPSVSENCSSISRICVTVRPLTTVTRFCRSAFLAQRLPTSRTTGVPANAHLAVTVASQIQHSPVHPYTLVSKEDPWSRDPTQNDPSRMDSDRTPHTFDDIWTADTPPAEEKRGWCPERCSIM